MVFFFYVCNYQLQFVVSYHDNILAELSCFYAGLGRVRGTTELGKLHGGQLEGSN